jgi:hypothetical protein
MKVLNEEINNIVNEVKKMKSDKEKILTLFKLLGEEYTESRFNRVVRGQQIFCFGENGDLTMIKNNRE